MKKLKPTMSIPTVEAEMLILADETGITEVTCPYCGEVHTHGRIYGISTKRAANCGKGNYFVNVVKTRRIEDE